MTEVGIITILEWIQETGVVTFVAMAKGKVERAMTAW